MILAIDTSTKTCFITFIDQGKRLASQWEADRQLADKLLPHLRNLLSELDKTWSDIESIAVFQGPGSFTGLRIGLTVMNTIADSLTIPIVGESGDDWLNTALSRLSQGDNDKLVMPVYGREANITKPRK